MPQARLVDMTQLVEGRGPSSGLQREGTSASAGVQLNGHHGRESEEENNTSFPKSVTEEGSTLHEIVGCHEFNW